MASSSTSWFETLSGRFLAVGGLVLIHAMIAAGYLITNIVTTNAVKEKAASTALFMQAITGDLVLGLASGSKLPPSAIENLNKLFEDSAFRATYPFLEIWTSDGEVAYSNSPMLIGSRFEHPPGLRLALAGEVAADYTNLLAREHALRGFSQEFLEIYSPIRDLHGSIVAVAETHEIADALKQQLNHIVRTTWWIVAGSTLLIMACLFGVVHRAGRTIEGQAKALKARVVESERMSEQNRRLRERAQRASARVAELNEKFLKGIGADLHDGPAQMLSFAVLQTGHLARLTAGPEREKATNTLAATLDQALGEIRGISKGLLLPDIEHRPLRAVIESAVKGHETRTGTAVALNIDTPDSILPVAVTTCVYRFVQEGLTNAYRHASGLDQIVDCRLCRRNLAVAVSNGRTASEGEAVLREGMGLFGLRSRVESLGGTLTFGSSPDGRVRLEMRLELDSISLDD